MDIYIYIHIPLSRSLSLSLSLSLCLLGNMFKHGLRSSCWEPSWRLQSGRWTRSGNDRSPNHHLQVRISHSGSKDRYIHICISTYLYIYTYIQRQREVGDSRHQVLWDPSVCAGLWGPDCRMNASLPGS